MRTIFKEEGMRGYFRGLSAAYLGTSHGVVLMYSYEETKRVMDLYAEKYDKKLGYIHYLSAGAISKLIASTITFPYTVVKARMQARPSEYRHSGGLLKTFVEIWKKEGFVGYYRGIVPGFVPFKSPTCSQNLIFLFAL